MSVLSKYFCKDLDISSPIQVDVARKVNYDEDGNEFITYEEVDYPKLQQSLGKVSDWSLDSLLKAGINPNFSIHTGNSTRLEGIDTLQQFDAIADSILSETENKE